MREQTDGWLALTRYWWWRREVGWVALLALLLALVAAWGWISAWDAPWGAPYLFMLLLGVCVGAAMFAGYVAVQRLRFPRVEIEDTGDRLRMSARIVEPSQVTWARLSRRDLRSSPPEVVVELGAARSPLLRVPVTQGLAPEQSSDALKLLATFVEQAPITVPDGIRIVPLYMEREVAARLLRNPPERGATLPLAH